MQTSWVCPDKNAKMTQQGLMLQGTKGEYKADHADRNLYFVTDDKGFEHYNPNFMKPYDDWDAPDGIDWTGYGFESNSQGILDVRRMLSAAEGEPKAKQLEIRRRMIEEWEAGGLRCMPRHALVGVAVNEAVRLSVDNGSRFVTFDEKMYPILE